MITSQEYVELLSIAKDLSQAARTVRHYCDPGTAHSVDAVFGSSACELADKLAETAQECDKLHASATDKSADNYHYAADRLYSAVGRFHRAAKLTDDFYDHEAMLSALDGLEFYIDHYLNPAKQTQTSKNKRERERVAADAPPAVKAAAEEQVKLSESAAKLLD